MPSLAALKPAPWRYVAFAALMLFFGAVGTRSASIKQGLGTPGPLAYVLIVIAAASLVLMRWRPVLAFTITSTAVVTYFAVGYAFGPILISAAAAVFMLARRVELHRAAIAVSVLYVAALIVGLAHGMFGHATWWGVGNAVIGVLTWIAVPTAIGTAIRTRRESQAGVRAEQARRAASEERLQMAQDLHDTLGHGLAVIAMHSGVALHVLDSHPDKARESLEAIRATSKESIDGLRAQLDLLRAGSTDGAPLRPRQGLADSEVLVRRIRSGGVDVAVDIPTLHGIPPDVDEAAYRILQESLTNVLRHAGPASACVRVRHDSGALSLDVVDTGSGPPHSAAATSSRGTGIRGMRARAESVGGTLAAGPGPEGGYAVHATLPCVLEETP